MFQILKICLLLPSSIRLLTLTWLLLLCRLIIICLIVRLLVTGRANITQELRLCAEVRPAKHRIRPENVGDSALASITITSTFHCVRSERLLSPLSRGLKCGLAPILNFGQSFPCLGCIDLLERFQPQVGCIDALSLNLDLTLALFHLIVANLVLLCHLLEHAFLLVFSLLILNLLQSERVFVLKRAPH